MSGRSATVVSVTLTDMLSDIAEAPESLFEDVVWDSFTSWTESRGISLYPA